MKTKISTQHGWSLIEMIIYIAILTILVSALVLTASTLLHSFVHMRAGESLAQSGVVALEHMTRELRRSQAVQLGASTLDASPGTLVVNTTDDAGNPTTITYTLTGDRIMVSQGGGASAPLTHDGVSITNLTFHHVSGANTEAVRVTFTASKNVRGTTVTKDYRSFIVLRGS